MKILQIVCIVATFLIWLLPTQTLAEQKDLNQFVTIVNPVRISTYTKDPGASIGFQYREVKKRNLPATWLLTYDAILDSGIDSVAKEMDSSQELGLFLEVTEGFAKAAGVTYNKTDSWHRANSVFLSGYTQDDRRKLIDTAFGKFKDTFGNYPSSVGAWWIDAYSLGYMKGKYQISANLTVADQFSTDGYQVWGQYFQTPFYPSKFHAGTPAQSLENKLDLVTIQWAPRDPLNGYGRGPASLFSTQDYFTVNLSDDYFQKLVRFYAGKHTNKFGQVTIGLEGDFSPQTYGGVFARQLDTVSELKNTGLVDIISLRDFAKWYRHNFPDLSPPQLLETDDLLGKKIKAIWYQSPNLRIFLTYDYSTAETKILDLRFYHDNFEEPYFISPNRDLDLSINIPSVIDSAENPQEAWLVAKEKLDGINPEGDDVILKYKNGTRIKLSKNGLIFSGLGKLPNALTGDPSLKINKQGNSISVFPERSWVFPQEGLIIKDLTPEATNFLRTRKVVLAEILIVVSFTVSLFFVGKRDLPKYKRLALLAMISVTVLGVAYFFKLNSRNYFVSQAETDALIRLSKMPRGKVVVLDKVCLQCSFHTKYPPAVFANKRHYVSELSKKPIIYDSRVFTAESREEARKNLKQLGASYIYVVRFEDYVEQVPFSPGDLNLEEVYSNANARIWRIKKN